MDPTTILSYGKKVLGSKAWSVELVLRIGVDLATAVNSYPNLSGKDKCKLVCETILKMLDDEVKVERERKVESIEIEKTIARLEECKNVVKVVLPVSLELVVMASRGKILLNKANEMLHQPCVVLPSLKMPKWWSCFSLCQPCNSAIHETIDVVEKIVKHPQDYLEEMRALASKMEKLHEEAKVFSSAAKDHDLSGVRDAAEVVVRTVTQIPPILESPVVKLPGELVNP